MQQLSMFKQHVYQPNPNEFRPLLFTLQSMDDCAEFRELLKTNAKIEVYDVINAQVSELIKVKNPSKKFTKQELEIQTNIYLKGFEPDLFGCWCFFSWSKKLVHILNEEDFIAVRTNRNKLKITDVEQIGLQNKCIGIIGLSVGQSIAITAIMERICGTIKLADFDTIDLSNLNRLRTGIQNLHLPKVIVAAREIAEIDPYIKVEIFNDGVNEENIDAFFTNLDLLVEVCDGLDIKVKSRIKARQLNIPVVMDTNDRGMIDIERFDLEKERKLFHGLVDESELSNLAILTPAERIGLIMKIVSFQNTSDRLKLSMSEIGKSISTWPQLASSIMLGAGATIDICRKILLKESVPSGRFYVDINELINVTSATNSNGKN